jgi:hypothetical protein
MNTVLRLIPLGVLAAIIAADKLETRNEIDALRAESVAGIVNQIFSSTETQLGLSHREMHQRLLPTPDNPEFIPSIEWVYQEAGIELGAKIETLQRVRYPLRIKRTQDTAPICVDSPKALWVLSHPPQIPYGQMTVAALIAIAVQTIRGQKKSQ